MGRLVYQRLVSHVLALTLAAFTAGYIINIRLTGGKNHRRLATNAHSNISTLTTSFFHLIPSQTNQGASEPNRSLGPQLSLSLRRTSLNGLALVVVSIKATDEFPLELDAPLMPLYVL